MRKTSIVLACIAATASLALVGCDVRKTQEGNVEVPKYEVSKTKEGDVTLPKYDVTAPKVDVSTTEKEVKVPEVKVESKEATITVPKIDVTPASEVAAQKDGSKVAQKK
ncbi:hypothetical protein LZ009_12725 [Ramlibacter sp. XY19]|uniref:hypothetical protein n=1 Tax=Ramlibacter paludis TaxID=2908000 RepID=UPI0023DA1FFD|nr:hypothetical protein [Ramlibacter paludis]MCG2593643.1 hypothetical protein [Ramlibacter paludis]